MREDKELLERLVELEKAIQKMQLEEELETKFRKYREKPSLFAKEICKKVFYEGDDYKPLPNPVEYLDSLADLNNKRYIIFGARGSGKTMLLAITALWSAIYLPRDMQDGIYEIGILAGSSEQAENLYKHIKNMINQSEYLKKYVEEGYPQKRKCKFITGGVIEVWTTSTKSVRSPHPSLLIIDEEQEAEKVEDGAIVQAALSGIKSGGNHGRIIRSSTIHERLTESNFVQLWRNAEREGYIKLKLNNEVGHRPWFDLEEQRRRFEDAKLTEPNFELEWLAELPDVIVGGVFDTENLDKAFQFFDMKELPIQHIWFGFDFGYSPHITVMTVAAKLENNMIAILDQYSFERTSPHELATKLVAYSSKYNTIELFGDAANTHGQLFLHELRNAGYNTHGVNFSQQKEMLISKINILLQQNKLLINKNCRELYNQMKKYHRDSEGKPVKGEDDFIDSLISAIASEHVEYVIHGIRKDLFLNNKSSNVFIISDDIIDAQNDEYNILRALFKNIE